MTTPGLPDLLHRFVATPYRYDAVFQSTIVSFETNDLALLMDFRASADQFVVALVSISDKPWTWKVVRDYDVSQQGNQAYLLTGETLSTLFVGGGTVVAIDWDRAELLGFLAENFSLQELRGALLDAAQQRWLLCDAFAMTPLPLHK